MRGRLIPFSEMCLTGGKRRSWVYLCIGVYIQSLVGRHLGRKLQLLMILSALADQVPTVTRNGIGTISIMKTMIPGRSGHTILILTARQMAYIPYSRPQTANPFIA